jgi:hypothetical protein
LEKTKGEFSNGESLPDGRYFVSNKIIYRYAFGERLLFSRSLADFRG